MARLHQRQPILLEGEYVARKNFTFNGQEFKAEDIFPYEKMGCDERKIATLFKAGYIIRPKKEEKVLKKTTLLKPAKKEVVKEEKTTTMKFKAKTTVLSKAERAKLRREKRKAQ